MRSRTPKVKFYLGNVREYESIMPAMRGVDLVFHAAALACGVAHVIVLSTDKAVYPINAMGMSKAL